MDRNSKINLAKLNSRISLEVLTLPVCGCRTYLITCCTALQNVSALKNDLVLQAGCFSMGIRSVVTCRDVSLHTFSTDNAWQTYCCVYWQ